MSVNEDNVCMTLLKIPETSELKKSQYSLKTVTNLPDRPRIDIEFTDLSYMVPVGRKGNKLLLRNVSGLFRSGQLTAILGPSGAGKSTLLNALAGYKCSDATGNILINGHPRNLRQFRRLSRYIMQEDLIQPHMTVLEAMRIAATLKLGTVLPREQKRAIINEILDMLRLNNCKNTITSRLSGGERKRLSIALELVNNPPVIFLDEPTTGLDDLSSSQCVSLLKQLAGDGRTVICSIHTPSARLFSMFDHIYVVADGQCAYQGRGSNIVPFLSSLHLECPTHYNPADFVIEVTSGEYGDHVDRMIAAVDNGRCYEWMPTPSIQVTGLEDEIISQCQANQYNNHEDVMSGHYKFDCSIWLQLKVLTYRIWLQNWRNSSQLLLKILLYAFIAFIISMLFWRIGNDATKSLFNYGFCYTCMIVFLYIPLLPVLLNFPMEVKLLKREYFNRWYSFNAFFIAHTVARMPLEIALGTMYLAVVYIATGQPLEFLRYAQFLVVCLLTGLSSESLGFAISSTFSVVNSMFLGPAVSVPFMLLAVYGLGSTVTAVPIYMKLFMYMSYLRYSLEGLTVATYGYDREPLYCPEEKIFCEFKYPQFLLQETGMETANIFVAVGGLIVFYVIFKMLSYFLLRRRLSFNKSFYALNYIGRFVKNYFNIAQHV